MIEGRREGGRGKRNNEKRENGWEERMKRTRRKYRGDGGRGGQSMKKGEEKI
jgi:hypothetical protein